VRVAVVPGPQGGCWLCELAEDGGREGTAVWREDFGAAAAAREQAGGVRWVWAATGDVYPALLRAGVRVERCHDVALTEGLLLGREGQPGQAASLAAAWARLRESTTPAERALRATAEAAASGGSAEPAQGGGPAVRGAAGPAQRGPAQRGPAQPGPAQRGAGQRGAGQRGAAAGQEALFEAADPVFASPAEQLDALIAVHADQVRRIAADEHPARFGLLTAAESATGLAAAEMGFSGMPWRVDVHDGLLADMLGPRPAPGLRPARLASLAARISEAFGGRPVNPDSPSQVLKALAADGVRVPSTRSHVLRGVDHPAVPLLLEYKELARIHAAHGWAWLDEWVTAGRFRPEYVVGGVVSGRWASRGGGALQIPRVLRRAVVADRGWVLVVADAAQLEPRVLAALSGDRALAAAAGTGDLYQALAGAFGGDRAKAKIAMLSAMYGGAAGEALQLLAVLRHRFPLAARYVEAAARAGEEGRVVRSRLGRTCPPPSAAWRGLTATPDDPGASEQQAGRSMRARGRFTRNFVVQASAADWATVLLAGLRRRLAAMNTPNDHSPPPTRTRNGHGAASQEQGPADLRHGLEGQPQRGAELVFFQHDEVIVHCPQALAPQVVTAIGDAAGEAGWLVFGRTPVRFPVTTAVVTSYADAK
jgi:DNA polymerase family A